MPGLDLDAMGPIDYLVIEFAAGVPADGSPFRHLAALVRVGTIRLLDLQLVRAGEDGVIVPIALDDALPPGSPEAPLVALLGDTIRGVLDQSDLLASAAHLSPGSTGAVIVFENRWAAPFAVALRRSGALLVEDTRLTIQAFLASMAH